MKNLCRHCEAHEVQRSNLLNFGLLLFSIENLAMTGESAQDSHTNHKN